MVDTPNFSGNSVDYKKTREGFLSPEQENDLCIAMKGGDINARNAIVGAYQPLIRRLARKLYRGSAQGLDLEDLIADGNVIFLDKIEEYNPSKGSMATFINVYIGQSLKNSLTRSKHIHIPESKATVVSPKGIPGRIRTSNLVLEYLRLNDRPTGQRQSVQDFLAYRSPHFSVDNFMVILNAMRGTTSIDTPLSRDDAHGETMKDSLESLTPAPLEILIEQETRSLQLRLPEIVAKIIQNSTLRNKPRALDIFRRRHGFGTHDGVSQNLTVIADVYGVSAERVRQIEGDVLRVLQGETHEFV